jgi:integrase
VNQASGPTKNVWETTDTARMVRHKHSRKYYGRYTLGGKQKWVNLDTTRLSVAKLRLLDETRKMEKKRALKSSVGHGDASMGQLMEIYLSRSRANTELRPSSIVARETALKKIKKTWPGLEDLDPANVKPSQVQQWATDFKLKGTGFVPPNAKKALRGNSATSVNRAIDTLRRVMDIAIEQGQIHVNPVSVKPAEGRLKKKVVSKKLVLPSKDQAERLLLAMRAAGAHGGWGIEASFLCRFLMMTGARIGEIPLTLWRFIDRRKNEIFLPGYKTEASSRYLPLFGELDALLREFSEWRKLAARHRQDRRDFLESSHRIFRISECQKTIDAACVQTGVTRITHHDFRHLFATVAIESGVDIPTVSRWLGHNDGGFLAMKTYGHLRQDHSQESAKKVRFFSVT